MLSLTIRENIVYSILKKISKVSVVQKKQEKEIVDQYIKELNVKTPSPEQLVKNLSGGNQQKVVLAKALPQTVKSLFLMNRPEVLMLVQNRRFTILCVSW